MPLRQGMPFRLCHGLTCGCLSRQHRRALEPCTSGCRTQMRSSTMADGCIGTTSGDTLYAMYHTAQVSAALGVPVIPGLHFRHWSNLAVPGMLHDTIDRTLPALVVGGTTSDLRAMCLPADNAGRLPGLIGGNSTCLFLRAEPPACQDSLLFTCAHTREGSR